MKSEQLSKRLSDPESEYLLADDGEIQSLDELAKSTGVTIESKKSKRKPKEVSSYETVKREFLAVINSTDEETLKFVDALYQKTLEYAVRTDLSEKAEKSVAKRKKTAYILAMAELVAFLLGGAKLPPNLSPEFVYLEVTLIAACVVAAIISTFPNDHKKELDDLSADLNVLCEWLGLSVSENSYSDLVKVVATDTAAKRLSGKEYYAVEIDGNNVTAKLMDPNSTDVEENLPPWLR